MAAATVLGLAMMGVPAGAETMPPQARNATLSVSGQGSIERAPDRAYVSFSIVTNDDSATRATSANNVAYNALSARMIGLGVPAGALKTTWYNVAYNARPPQPNPQFQQRYGYVVTRSVTVTTDRTDAVGAIVDGGIAAGSTTVGGVSFGLRDGRSAARMALAEAMSDAEAQARALADAAHLRLVRILSIGAGAASAPPVRAYQGARAVMMAAPAAVPTDVQPSDLTVTGSVTVVYEVAP